MIDLVAGNDRVAIDPARGGRLVSLVAGGRERILTSPSPVVDVDSIARECYLMAPFVGRLRDGAFDWRGRHYEVPRNLGAHAIHGAVFDVPWSVDELDPGTARLSVGLDPDRWPFRGRAREDVALTPGRLTLGLEVVAEETMPVAVGWHPWFRLAPGEDVGIQVLGSSVLETGEGLIPTGRRIAVDECTDLRSGPQLAGRRLDNTYTDVRSPAVIRWPDLELEMAFEHPISALVVFTPPGAFCVEPQTAWPDAIRLAGEGIAGTGLAILDAGDVFRAETTWRWRRRQS